MRPFLIWQASVTAATLNIVSFVERLDRWRREKPDALAVVDYDIVQSKSQRSLVRRSAVTTAELWQQVLALTTEAHRLNELNGTLIATRLRGTQRALTALFSAARIPGAYAVDGSTVPFHTTHRLAVA